MKTFTKNILATLILCLMTLTGVAQLEVTYFESDTYPKSLGKVNGLHYLVFDQKKDIWCKVKYTGTDTATVALKLYNNRPLQDLTTVHSQVLFFEPGDTAVFLVPRTRVISWADQTVTFTLRYELHKTVTSAVTPTSPAASGMNPISVMIDHECLENVKIEGLTSTDTVKSFETRIVKFDCNIQEQVKIELLNQAGVVVQNLALSTDADSTFEWTVSPLIPSGLYKIRITSLRKPTTLKTETAVFRILQIANFDVAPVANIKADTTQICLGEEVILSYEYTEGGTPLGYTWTFDGGQKVAPLALNPFGPHHILFATSGIKHITVSVYNNGGSDIDTIEVEVLDQGTCPALFSVDTLVDFGEVALGQRVNELLTMTNHSNKTLNIVISYTGYDFIDKDIFDVTVATIPMAPNSTDNIPLYFLPDDYGQFVQNFSFTASYEQTKNGSKQQLNCTAMCSAACTNVTCYPLLGTWGLPVLNFPLKGNLSDYKLYSYAFGSNWLPDKLCGGKVKKHIGLDIKIPSINGKDRKTAAAYAGIDRGVYASFSGTVKAVYLVYANDNRQKGIVIEHNFVGNIFTTSYLHLDANSINVSEGDYINAGTRLGEVWINADNGWTHLHFGIRRHAYDETACRGALPQKIVDCICIDDDGRADPVFPEYFINPKELSYNITLGLNKPEIIALNPYAGANHIYNSVQNITVSYKRNNTQTGIRYKLRLRKYADPANPPSSTSTIGLYTTELTDPNLFVLSSEYQYFTDDDANGNHKLQEGYYYRMVVQAISPDDDFNNPQFAINSEIFEFSIGVFNNNCPALTNELFLCGDHITNTNGIGTVSGNANINQLLKFGATVNFNNTTSTLSGNTSVYVDNIPPNWFYTTTNNRFTLIQNNAISFSANYLNDYIEITNPHRDILTFFFSGGDIEVSFDRIRFGSNYVTLTAPQIPLPILFAPTDLSQNLISKGKFLVSPTWEGIRIDKYNGVVPIGAINLKLHLLRLFQSSASVEVKENELSGTIDIQLFGKKYSEKTIKFDVGFNLTPEFKWNRFLVDLPVPVPFFFGLTANDGIHAGCKDFETYTFEIGLKGLSFPKVNKLVSADGTVTLSIGNYSFETTVDLNLLNNRFGGGTLKVDASKRSGSIDIFANFMKYHYLYQTNDPKYLLQGKMGIGLSPVGLRMKGSLDLTIPDPTIVTSKFIPFGWKRHIIKQITSSIWGGNYPVKPGAISTYFYWGWGQDFLEGGFGLKLGGINFYSIGLWNYSGNENDISCDFGVNYYDFETRMNALVPESKETITGNIYDFTVNNPTNSVIIYFSGNNELPNFSIQLPDSTIIDQTSTIDLSNIQYYEDISENIAFFVISAPSLGDYRVNVANADSFHIVGSNRSPFIHLYPPIIDTISKIVEFNWIDDDDDNAIIELFYSSEPNVYGSGFIAGNILQQEMQNKYIWHYEEMPTDNYYFCASIRDTLGQTNVSFVNTPYLLSNGNINPPLNLTFQFNDTCIILNWIKNNTIGKNYSVCYANNPNKIDFISNYISAGDTNTIVLKNLPQGRYYEFRVTAIDSNSVMSVPSNTVSFNYALNFNKPFLPEQNFKDIAYVGNQYFYQVIYNNFSNQNVSFAIENHPNGMIIDNNGYISFLPTNENTGLFNLKIKINDDIGNVDSMFVIFKVVDAYSARAQIELNKSTFVDFDDVAFINLFDYNFNGNKSIVDTTSIRVYSNSDINGIYIQIPETEFASNEFTTLLRFDSNNSSNGKLLVSKGDTIWIEYHDLSPDTIVRKFGYFTTFDANFSFPAVICSNDNIQLRNLSTGSGLSYHWDFGDGFTSSEKHPKHEFPQLAFGNDSAIYNVKLVATDERGIQDSITKAIVIYQRPLVELDDYVSGCDKVVLVANETENSLLWSTGDTTLTTVINQSGYVTLMVTNKYCSNNDSVFVEVFNSPDIEFSSLPSICGNATAITATISGTSPYNYVWDSNPQLNSYILQNAIPGWHYLQVTDVHDCENTDSILITTTPALSVLVQPQSTTCEETDGSLIITPENGTGTTVNCTLSATINNQLLTWNYTLNNNAPYTISNLQPAIYEVVLTDMVGCTAQAQAVITNNGNAIVSQVNAQNETCHTGNGVGIVEQVFGGSGSYMYEWFDSNAISVGTTAQVNNLSAGVYTVTIADQMSNCATSNTIEISNEGEMVQTLSKTDATCAANNGTTVSNVTQSQGAVSYIWTNTNNVVVSNTNAANNLSAGWYRCETSDNYCVLTDSIEVVNQDIEIQSISSLPNSCEGTGNATVVATTPNSPLSYLWDNNGTQPTAQNLSLGEHSVVVSDAAGCNKIATISVVSSISVVIDTEVSGDNGTGNGTAGVIVLQSNGNPQYLWSNGETTPQINNVVSGDYWVVVTDQENCTASDTVNVFTVNIYDLESENSNLRVYPNPTSGLVTIELTNATSIKVEVFSINGQSLVKTEGINSLQIDFANFANGSYIVKVLINNSSVATMKVVKK